MCMCASLSLYPSPCIFLSISLSLYLSFSVNVCVRAFMSPSLSVRACASESLSLFKLCNLNPITEDPIRIRVRSGPVIWRSGPVHPVQTRSNRASGLDSRLLGECLLLCCYLFIVANEYLFYLSILFERSFILFHVSIPFQFYLYKYNLFVASSFI